jgi:hypothetical protein
MIEKIGIVHAFSFKGGVMANLVKVKAGDMEIWFETEGELSGHIKPQRGNLDISGETMVQAVMSFDMISDTINAYFTSLIETFKALKTESAPDKITSEFGLKVSGEGNVYVVKASTEATLKITAEWGKVGDR